MISVSSVCKPKKAGSFRNIMEQICPGLPDWNALTSRNACRRWRAPETFPNGRLLDYPADWGSRSPRSSPDNEFNILAAVPAGSEGALVAELEVAAAAKKPLLMMFWAPHFALAESRCRLGADAAL